MNDPRAQTGGPNRTPRSEIRPVVSANRKKEPGRKHDATLAAYQQAARKNAAHDKFGKVHVEVVSFDAVTDPEEIAFDLVTLVS